MSAIGNYYIYYGSLDDAGEMLTKSDNTFWGDSIESIPLQYQGPFTVSD